jgi:hypothetical protein
MKSSRNKFAQENIKNKNARKRIRSWIVSQSNLTRVRLRCVTLVIKKPLGGASWPRRGGPETGNHLCQTLYLCCLCSSFFFAKFSCSKSADFSLISAFIILTISSTKKIYFSFLVFSLCSAGWIKVSVSSLPVSQIKSEWFGHFRCCFGFLAYRHPC